MVRRKIAQLLVLVMPVLALSQSRDTVFTVKAPSTSIKLLPQTDVLYENMSRRFKLVMPSTMKIDTVIFEGGTVKVKDSILVLKPTKSKTVLLKIYEKLEDGKSSLALVKAFSVVKFVEPKPNVDGVDNDSAIHRLRVVAMGYVSVPMRPDKELKRISYKVLSFEMEGVDSSRVKNLKTTGNRMSYAMRDMIDRMTTGNSIQINNINYLMGPDTFTIQQPLRIYILNDTINKF